MIYRFATCELDADRRVLRRGDAPVSVEPQVFDLILLLAQNGARMVTRDEIIAEVWGGRIVSESAISARIAAARKAVGDDGKRQEVIRTVARRGLQMVAEVDAGPRSQPMHAEPDPQIRYTRNPTGQTLAYAISGSGPPVIRISHGYTDVSAEWHKPHARPIFDAIGARNRLVRFDHIGTGQSDHDIEKVDFDTEAEDVISVADAAGCERFALFSESGGCSIALRVAAKYPDRVTRLAMNGAYLEGRGHQPDATASDPIKGLIDVAWSRNEPSFAASYIMAYFPEGPLETVRRIADEMMAASPKAFMLLTRDAVNQACNAHLLPKIKCPVLILNARHDPMYPLSEARRMAADLPDASLVVLEGANHMPLPGNACFEPYLGSLTDFLAKAD